MSIELSAEENAIFLELLRVSAKFATRLMAHIEDVDVRRALKADLAGDRLGLRVSVDLGTQTAHCEALPALAHDWHSLGVATMGAVGSLKPGAGSH